MPPTRPDPFPPSEAPARRRRLAALAVVVLGWLAFAPALGNGFAMDDTLAQAVDGEARNRAIAELRSPWYYFTSDYWDGRGARSGLFRPVTIYSFALTHHLCGAGGTLEAMPHHLLNLLLNGLAAGLVLWLMLDFGLALGGAVLTAALFAVHAIHSEVVATVIGRGELLAFCFGLLGLLALRRAQDGRRGGWVAGSALLFFLAFGSKESALAFVPMVPCYLWARAWQRGVRAATPWRLVVLALLPGLLGFLWLRGIAVAGGAEPIRYAANPLAHVDGTIRVLTALDLWGEGLGLCLWPSPLACLYGPRSVRLVEGFAHPGPWLALLVFAAWLFAALRRPRRTPGLLLAAAFFFGFGFLTSNLPFAIGTIFGERLYFTPSLGVCMLPALLLPLLRGRGRVVLVLLCVVWGSWQLAVDWPRSRVWRDNETLFLHESAAWPDCAFLQLTAAKLFETLEFRSAERAGSFREKTRSCLARARRLDPEYVDAVSLEARVLERDGQVDAAIAALEGALGMRRLAISGIESELREHLGRLLITHRDQVVRGLGEASRALELRPLDQALRSRIVELGLQRVRFLVADPERRRQRAREVVDVLQIVLRAVPVELRGRQQFLAARLHLAECHEILGEVEPARRAYREVLAAPGVPEPVRQRALARLQALGG